MFCDMKYFSFERKLLVVSLMVCTLAVRAQPSKTVNQKAPDTRSANPLSDSALLDLVQKKTFKYFWDFAHPVSGLARERSNIEYDYGDEVVTTGGSGFGIMAIIVASNRHWITRDSAVKHLLKTVNFLLKANSYHGIFPHWLNGATGSTIPFSRKDDGGDVVETSYLFEGLLCARQYFDQQNPLENQLRTKINWLWTGAEWSWHQRDMGNSFYWHWSPNNGWSMNFELRGWNECLITYVLSASSPDYPITEDVYRKCWAESNHFINGRTYYGIKLPLGFPYGGPLFFAHYSFMGLNPHGLKDQYADYWEQNVSHTQINYIHCVLNPNHFKGYGENCWGLTASDTYDGYNAQSPDNDFGTITPTAALSSFPYTPDYSMKALKHFYYDLGDKIWGEYGFTDAFNESKNWYAKSYLAIDEGPIVVMIENYRTGLLWKLFMSCPEVQSGLKKLGFESLPGRN
jgi:hypothetical protein